MSIINSFDSKTKAMISPEDIVGQSEQKIKTVILTFSHKIMTEILNSGLAEEVLAASRGGNGPVELYRVKGTDIGVFETPVGAPMTIGKLEDFRVILGIENVVAFGTCGVLTDLEEGKCIIPTSAYRDEGTSYHYAPASDYIEVKNADRMAEIFDELGLDYVKGKTWTTDAVYRETMGNRDKRVAEGCIAVDMECSALQAMCDFRGMELYQFFYGADSLSGSQWEKRILGNYEISDRMKFFHLALEVAKIVDKRCK